MKNLIHSVRSMELVGEAIIVLGETERFAHIGIETDGPDERCQNLHLEFVESVTSRERTDHQVPSVLRGLLVVDVVCDRAQQIERLDAVEILPGQGRSHTRVVHDSPRFSANWSWSAESFSTGIRKMWTRTSSTEVGRLAVTPAPSSLSSVRRWVS